MVNKIDGYLNRPYIKKYLPIIITFILFLNIEIVVSENNEDFFCSLTIIDLDQNNLIDFLSFNCQFNIYEQGKYLIYGLLSDIDNNYIDSVLFEKELNIGNQNISLKFDGALIYQKHYSGQFKLNKLIISTEEGEQLFSVNDSFITDKYNYKDFERPFVYNNGEILEQGIDIDQNGLYESLKVTIPIEVQKSGNYSFEGTLYSDGESITTSTNMSHFGEGNHNITLLFYGAQIALFSSNNMSLIELNIYEEYDYNLIISEKILHNITSVTPEEFDIPPTSVLHTKINDYGKDTDDNGLFESLIVEIVLNIHEKDNYNLIGQLYDYYHNLISIDNNIIQLDTRLQTVQLSFPSQQIRQYSIDGYYEVKIQLYRTDNNTKLSETSYITNSYNYTDFEEPVVTIRSITNDYGNDITDDGLYDYLSINLQLFSESDNEYYFEACLFDENHNPVTMVYKNLNINRGYHNISLDFYGNKIKNYYSNPTEYNVSATFSLPYINLYDENEKLLITHETNYYTSEYNINDFSANQPPSLSSSEDAPFMMIFTLMVIVVIFLFIIIIFKSKFKSRNVKSKRKKK